MLADYHLHLENGPLTREYLEDFSGSAGKGPGGNWHFRAHL